MIKRFSFTGGEKRWAAAADAPGHVRPERTAVCVVLPEFGPARHEGVGITWFRDEAHLRRFTEWAGPEESVVLAEEVVLRGADWLERRWDAGEKLKHMALAVRADGLSPAEFSERWRGHAGTVQGRERRTVIPGEARGLAYVQNHPLTGARAYDAINEVYFDDAAGLRTRIEWFGKNLGAEGDTLVKRSWFLSVREYVL